MEPTNESARLDVLIVARDPMDPILIRRLLGEHRNTYQIHSVLDGLAAMEYLQGDQRLPNGRRPDLVVMNLDLPKLTGYQILTWLRQNQNVQNIPVVVFERPGDQTNGKYLLRPVQAPHDPAGWQNYSPFLKVVATYLNQK